MIYTNATLATMQSGAPAYGLLANAAVVIDGSDVAWCGPAADVPGEFEAMPAADVGGRLLTPGLIDAHTHLVYAGNRADEFEQRLNGASYAEIARRGGGILRTVAATRRAGVTELVASALPRVDALLAEGVTTIEIKSGYGLEPEAELNMLRAARRLGKERAVRIVCTYLGAHATPEEYRGRADAYIDEIVIPTLRVAHVEGLVDAVDGFCESIGFNCSQIRRVFAAARELHIPVKLHADQLSNQGGAGEAAGAGALSADHLEYVDNAGIRAMAANGTVAMLLPGAFFTLRQQQAPPVAEFRQHGVPMAVATDSNPGSSPVTSLLTTMNMACTLFGLTPEEALAGTTRCAAQALGLAASGVIKAGYRADIAIWNVTSPAELAYRIGFNPLYKRIFGGAA